MLRTDPVPSVFVSVVSHRQGALARQVIEDLTACPEVAEVALTYNLAEPAVELPQTASWQTTIVHNRTPRGFAANHNAAFKRCRQPFFCVVNPDIRLRENPFPKLLACLEDELAAIAGPAVINPSGGMEDSARRFPTPIGLTLKLLGINDGRYVFRAGDPRVSRPDWIAGMFMLFRSSALASVGGFDEGFYLYYEDIDVCARLRKAGHEILLCRDASVIHDPRRTSHRNLQYFSWHVRSIGRYFVKHLGRLPERT